MPNFPVTSDAGPLIHLAKIGLLDLLRDNYSIVMIPREVKIEVVDQGKEKGAADALLVEEAIRAGWVRPVDVKMSEEFLDLCGNAGVDRGEAEVLRYAMLNGGMVLLDDEAPRELARSLGIPVRGTLGVLVESVQKNRLAAKEALRKLDELADFLFVSSRLYRLTRQAIENAT